jgi:hypothetical protein
MSININELKQLLNDVKQNSSVEIEELTEASQKSDIVLMAQKAGIDLKGNQDLAGFKQIYALTETQNANGVTLNDDVANKKLNTIIGKPIDIDHIRKYVIGHYIGASKEGKVITTYGVIYKSNFQDEWEEAKQLFAEGKLSTSWEIMPVQGQVEYNADGTRILNDYTFAGGAILFKSKPAVKEAKVLEMAKKHSERTDLVYANQDEQIINSATDVTCSKCQHRFIALDDENEFKTCPNCKCIVNKNGEWMLPPQTVDFECTCPECQQSKWKILENNSSTAKIACKTENCSSVYNLTFKASENKDLNKQINRQFQSNWELQATCPQCNRQTKFVILSNEDKKNIECEHCKLNFEFSWSQLALKEIESMSIEQKTDEQKAEELKVAEELKAAEEQKAAELKAEELKKAAQVQPIKVEESKEYVELNTKFVDIETKHNEVLTKLTAAETELTNVKAEVASKVAELEGAKLALTAKDAEMASLKAATDEQVAMYKTNAVTIKQRRDEVGEFGKDLTDAEILIEDKYELAKSQKAAIEAQTSKAEKLTVSAKDNEESLNVKLSKGLNDYIKIMNS